MLEISRKTRRPLVCFEDLPEKEKADFDYIKDDARFTPRLFSYLGSWYDCHEFENTFTMGYSRGISDSGWDLVQTDTHQSGVFLNFLNECNMVHVANFHTEGES
jgi:hypothetical protein